MKNFYHISSILTFLLIESLAIGQNVGINISGSTPNTSAILDLSTGNSSANKGFLTPQVALTSTSSALPISNPATGLILYDTATAGTAPNNVVPGYYFWNGSAWLLMIAPGAGTSGLVLNSNGGGMPVWGSVVSYIQDSSWATVGNHGTSRTTNFLGTTDNNDLVFKVNNNYSGIIDNASDLTFFGYEAGYNDISIGGAYNTAFGFEALYTNSSNYSGGTNNTAMGYKALYNLTTGTNNTANGYEALFSNTSGSDNTANGYEALYSSTTATQNCANGYEALYSNTTGTNNSANGYEALYTNTTGSDNNANGYQALYKNTSGGSNSANGYEALYNNTTGGDNTANGYEAMFTNTTGANNIANGYEALFTNSTGINNTSNGSSSLPSNVGSSNTAVGRYALNSNTYGDANAAIGDSAGYFNTTGSFNTYIGCRAGANASLTTLTNITCLGYYSGYSASTLGSNSIYLGNASITNIYSEVQSISAYSDRRIKDDINENVPGLSFITKLHPVTFNYNLHKQNQILGVNENNTLSGEYDIEKITQSGFIAQDVDAAAKACGYDFNGIIKPQTPEGLYRLGYTDFVVPLVKAVQEQQHTIDSITASNFSLKSQLNKQTASLSQEQQKYNSALNSEEQEITELNRMINNLQVQSNKR